MEFSEKNKKDLSLWFVRNNLQQNKKFKQMQGLLGENQGLSKSYKLQSDNVKKCVALKCKEKMQPTLFDALRAKRILVG